MPMVRVKAFAKLNLSLEVLNKRPDGYHNLRTVFQTISLADTLDIDVRRARQTRIELESDVEIPGENLIVRAADAVLATAGITAAIRVRLRKRIPLGGGLGGGSTDAAAVLLALPVLLRRNVDEEVLYEIGARLGSDVPFFLTGGTALGLGRGTELYPLADAPAVPALVVSPGIHVSTADAYRTLNRSTDPPPETHGTARLAEALASGWPLECWTCGNDFEKPVLARNPEIGAVERKLTRLGAKVAMMTGSGSAVFGLFDSLEARDRAATSFGSTQAHRVSLTSRARYRAVWRKALSAKGWPPLP